MKPAASELWVLGSLGGHRTGCPSGSLRNVDSEPNAVLFYTKKRRRSCTHFGWPAIVSVVFLFTSAGAVAEQQHVSGVDRVASREAPLPAEAQAAVRSVLGTLRQSPSASASSLISLAQEVARTPGVITRALIDTQAGNGERARTLLRDQSARIRELRAAHAEAGKWPIGPETESYLDELLAVMDGSARELSDSSREQGLSALNDRFRSGALPARQPVYPTRSPTILFSAALEERELLDSVAPRSPAEPGRLEMGAE